MAETETDHERARRVVRETGERLRKDCVILAKRHNDWLLRAVRGRGKTVDQLHWLQPGTWVRDIGSELGWMRMLGLVDHDEHGRWHVVAD